MKEEVANLVHPVFNHGLKLLDRLARGEHPNMATEQAALKGLLLSEMEARRLPEFGGDSVDGRSLSVSRAGDGGRRDGFRGIRYALACWLDEVFIEDSPWSRDWTEQTLETALYDSRLGGDPFWEQARLAEARPGSDALEVFFLCVMLGFRGNRRGEPEELQKWVTVTQARISRSQSQELTLPPEHEPPTFVPPRHGREKLQRMLLILTFVLLVFIVTSTAVGMNVFWDK